ncbi:xanthine dehydrogenase family protein subunit M [Thermosipho sp. 1074]|uniref:FAD binding domain-containing protein n=1 Tax=Thermosipho sp. 1074 TaxID=1643331 RepID=UPI000986B3D3|nr:FAD binding domain-containing protein [Thermosipho sp. 1074]OOC42074.1 FAD-binding protein [Thermosipho sp. 1074]
MIYFREYLKPKNLQEAYEVLTSKNAKIIGGATFLKLSNQSFETAIDLIDAKLDFIRESENEIEIGAMVTLSEFEDNTIISNLYNGFLKNITENILSFQMRNLITVGGTIFPKFGFSDLITGLLVLETEVHLYKNGKIRLEDFLNTKIQKDILEKITIKKKTLAVSFKNIKNSEYDFSIINIAVSKSENEVKIAVGARPAMAVLITKDLNFFEDIDKAVESLLNKIKFSDDLRASKIYRQKVCKALLKRALREVIQ